MNATLATPRRAPFVSWILLTGCLGGMISPLDAAPPESRRKADSRPALQRLGDFFFGSSRASTTVKKQTFRPELVPQSAVITSSYAVSSSSGSDPVISAQEIRAAVPGGRSQLVLPVTPGISPRAISTQEEVVLLNSRFDTSARSVELAPEPSVPAPAPMALPPIPERPDYGKPVPGSRGYVYAPHSPEGQGYVIDVRGLQPGAKVRDPRTGHVFLVPPF